MFYVIADAAPFGLRLTPDEGADIVRITEMIKAAANEQLPVVHPDQPGFAGITIGQLSGPAHDPANSRRNVVTVSTGTLDWDRPGDLDRRHRPLAVRDRDVGPDGDAATRRASCASATTFRHEGILGTVFTGRVVEETHDRAVPGDRPDHHRPGLDHRLRELRRRPDRPVPRRLHRSATSGASALRGGRTTVRLPRDAASRRPRRAGPPRRPPEPVLARA